MANHKKGNLGQFMPVIQEDQIEIIDRDAKTPVAGVGKGDIIFKTIEAAPAVVESVSGAYKMRQQTLIEREKTKGLEYEANKKITELKSTTAQILSENEKQIQALRNEDSKHERETGLERENAITEREVKLKELDHQHHLEMKKLEMDGERLEWKTTTVEILQKAIQLKIEKGEDYSTESQLLLEAIKKLDQ
jgi:hypothetical protein